MGLREMDFFKLYSMPVLTQITHQRNLSTSWSAVLPIIVSDMYEFDIAQTVRSKTTAKT